MAPGPHVGGHQLIIPANTFWDLLRLRRERLQYPRSFGATASRPKLDIPYVVSVALKYTSCVVDDAATGAAGVHLQALEGVLAQAETALFPAAGRMHAGLLYILRHARRRLA